MTFPAEVREQARYVDGADVDGYERGRPEYPQPVYDHGDPAVAHPDAVGAVLGQRRSGPVKFELDTATRCSDLREQARLVDVAREVIRWSVPLDAEQVRAMYASFITLRRGPEAEREVLLDRIEAIVSNDFGGRVQHPIVTAIYTGRRP